MIVHIIAVFELPPRAFCSNRVSFESLNDTWVMLKYTRNFKSFYRKEKFQILKKSLSARTNLLRRENHVQIKRVLEEKPEQEIFVCLVQQKVSEFDQEILQTHTADQPKAP